MQRKEEMPKDNHKIRRNRLLYIRKALGLILIIVAIYLLLSPDMTDLNTRNEAERIRESFIITRDMAHIEVIPDDFTETADVSKRDPVLERLEAYNNSLHSTQQRSQIEGYIKTDAWNEEEVFGTLQIPSINVDMPLYVGTSDNNLAAGAAVLEGTSLPIGGPNSNCVISGHRGWKGAAYLKEIEGVNFGDEIIITNPWETLTYKVCDMFIIHPSESEPLLIKDGRDMLTIVTCHPYRSPRNMRYVLYAERVSSPGDENTEMVQNITTETTAAPEQKEYEREKEELLAVYGSSTEEIRMENMLRRGSGIFFIVLFILFVTLELKNYLKEYLKS